MTSPIYYLQLTVSTTALNGHCQEEAIQSCSDEIHPSTWLQYIDDVVEAIQKDKVEDF